MIISLKCHQSLIKHANTHVCHQEDVPDNVKMVTLPCVWHLALSSNSRSEVNSWFDVRLRNYLRFLSKSLISFNEVQNASCLALQKL